MKPSETSARRNTASRMASAAQRFLSNLDAGQKRVALHPFSDADERASWFYTPTDHGGLTIAEMSARQQRLAMATLATGLSEAGYNTAATIMGLEAILESVEGHSAGFGHDRARDPGRYYLRIFGDPTVGTWGWRFGGHHISVNHTIIDGILAGGTPSFFGADPATSPLLGPHFLRPLGGLVDRAYDLAEMFNPQQQGRAVVAAAAPSDTVAGNRTSVDLGPEEFIEPLSLADVWRERFPEPTNSQLKGATDAAHRQLGFGDSERVALRLSATPIGLAAAEMTQNQRACLASLLEQYVRRLPEAIADSELQKITGHRFDTLHFAWAGSLKRGQPMYYRIQGDALVIELDNSQRDANHIHSVWRDPKGDFGRDVLADHYRTHPHHNHS